MRGCTRITSSSSRLSGPFFSSTASSISYQYTLGAGQVLSAGTSWIFAAQSSGSGTMHPTSGDTYAATYTAGGVSFTVSGHF